MDWKDGNRNWREGNGLERRTGIGTGEKEMDWKDGNRNWREGNGLERRTGIRIGEWES